VRAQITPGGARAAIEEIIAGSNSLLEGLSFGGMAPYLEVEALWIELRNRKREQQRKGTLAPAPALLRFTVRLTSGKSSKGRRA
jgi:hypothetical protein